jgi:hypothetical protein
VVAVGVRADFAEEAFVELGIGLHLDFAAQDHGDRTVLDWLPGVTHDQVEALLDYELALF